MIQDKKIKTILERVKKDIRQNLENVRIEKFYADYWAIILSGKMYILGKKIILEIFEGMENIPLDLRVDLDVVGGSP